MTRKGFLALSFELSALSLARTVNTKVFKCLWAAVILLLVPAPGMALEPLPGRERDQGVIFENNEIYQNHFQGIRVRGDIPVIIKNSTFRSNGRGGIAIERRSEVRATGCDFFQNGRAGINVDETKSATIDNNKIHDNKMAGIRIWRSGEKEDYVSSVKISNNRIYGNGQAGIRSMPQQKSKVDLAVIGNEIHNNDEGGVRVENNTKLTAEGNNIFENGTAGIMCHKSVVPPVVDIYRNNISFSRGVGIHVLSGQTGRIGIRNNWVYNNQRGGIVCGLWNVPDIAAVDAEIINNTIVSNGSSDQGAGIRNDSKGEVIMMNNIIAFNYVSGIITRRCTRYSHNLLFANGDVGNCCDDPDWAPYWIESLQLGGCLKRGKGDLICNPLFVDPDNYNFHLGDNSPAIDSGDKYDDVSMPPSKGTKRNDMGATGGPYAITQQSFTSKSAGKTKRLSRRHESRESTKIR